MDTPDHRGLPRTVGPIRLSGRSELRRVGTARDRWFDDYIRQSLERDAIELVRIRQRTMLRELLSRLAGRTAQVLNLANASQGLTGNARRSSSR